MAEISTKAIAGTGVYLFGSQATNSFAAGMTESDENFRIQVVSTLLAEPTDPSQIVIEPDSDASITIFTDGDIELTPADGVLRSVAVVQEGTESARFRLIRLNNGAAVAAGEELGTVSYRGYDGTDHQTAARVTAYVDGAVSPNVVPGRLVFSTSNLVTENVTRGTIGSSGNWTIATADSGTTMTISGGGLNATGTITFPTIPSVTVANTRLVTVNSATGQVGSVATTSFGFTWNEVTGTSSNMAVSNGYIANNAGLVTLTLPATAAVGDVVRVAGKGAGLWSIAQNAGQLINYGSAVTTTGVGGSLAASARYDTVELLCITANTTWEVLSGIGTLIVT